MVPRDGNERKSVFSVSASDARFWYECFAFDLFEVHGTHIRRFLSASELQVSYFAQICGVYPDCYAISGEKKVCCSIIINKHYCGLTNPVSQNLKAFDGELLPSRFVISNFITLVLVFLHVC
jgi:hypothetical protein